MKKITTKETWEKNKYGGNLVGPNDVFEGNNKSIIEANKKLDKLVNSEKSLISKILNIFK